MTNSPFLAVPPIYEHLISKDDPQKVTISDVWKNHMDAISQTLGVVVSYDRFSTSQQATPVSIVVSMDTTHRNQLENAFNGQIIYNTTTNRFNFRENGAWVTFTPVAA
jgi:hypothetical protein